MKRWSMVMALAAVALVFAWPSVAQVGADGTKYTTGTGTRLLGVNSDSTQRLLRADAQGYLQVGVTNAPQNMVLIQPSFLTSRFVYGADGTSAGWTSPKTVTVDSTSVLVNTLGYNRLALLLTVAFEDSVGAGLFAFQYRGAMNSATSDTTNTYTLLEPLSARYGRGTTNTVPDTIGRFLEHEPRGKTWGASLADTSTLYTGERMVVLQPSVNGSSYFLPLKSADGAWFSPPYLGLRWRIMNTFFEASGGGVGGLVAIGNAGKAYGAAPTVTGAGMCETCAGSAGSVGKYITVRADLVGWRE